MTADGRELAAVFTGGVAGTMARAALAEAIPRDPGQWPWATLAVNVVAALLLGLVVTWHERHPSPPPYRRPLLGTGLCGGLSTFATVQLELFDMLDGGHIALAAGYAAASLGGGALALAVATAISRRSWMPA